MLDSNMESIFRDQFASIGQIVATKGVLGHLEVILNENHTIDWQDENFIFIGINNLPVPFEIMEYKKYKDHHVFLLSHITDRTEAIRLIKEEILFLKNELKNVTNSKDHAVLYKGWNIISNDEIIGQILEVEKYPAQWMATVKLPDNSIKLLPLVEEWIVSVCEEDEQIEMSIPDGLI